MPSPYQAYYIIDERSYQVGLPPGAFSSSFLVTNLALVKLKSGWTLSNVTPLNTVLIHWQVVCALTVNLCATNEPDDVTTMKMKTWSEDINLLSDQTWAERKKPKKCEAMLSTENLQSNPTGNLRGGATQPLGNN
mgnify:CR=1 FL=1